MEEVESKVLKYKTYLKSNHDGGKILHIFNKLLEMPISVNILQNTGIGKVVNGFRKKDGEIGKKAKLIVSTWKTLVAEEQLRLEAENEALETTNQDESVENSPANQEEDVVCSSENEAVLANDVDRSDVDENGFIDDEVNISKKCETERQSDKENIKKERYSGYRKEKEYKKDKQSENRDRKKEKHENKSAYSKDGSVHHKSQSDRQHSSQSDKHGSHSDNQSKHTDKYSSKSDKHSSHSEINGKHRDKHSSKSDSHRTQSEKSSKHIDRHKTGSDNHKNKSDNHTENSDKNIDKKYVKKNKDKDRENIKNLKSTKIEDSEDKTFTENSSSDRFSSSDHRKSESRNYSSTDERKSEVKSGNESSKHSGSESRKSENREENSGNDSRRSENRSESDNRKSENRSESDNRKHSGSDSRKSEKRPESDNKKHLGSDSRRSENRSESDNKKYSVSDSRKSENRSDDDDRKHSGSDNRKSENRSNDDDRKHSGSDSRKTENRSESDKRKHSGNDSRKSEIKSENDKRKYSGSESRKSENRSESDDKKHSSSDSRKSENRSDSDSRKHSGSKPEHDGKKHFVDGKHSEGSQKYSNSDITNDKFGKDSERKHRKSESKRDGDGRKNENNSESENRNEDIDCEFETEYSPSEMNVENNAPCIGMELKDLISRFSKQLDDQMKPEINSHTDIQSSGSKCESRHENRLRGKETMESRSEESRSHSSPCELKSHSSHSSHSEKDSSKQRSEKRESSRSESNEGSRSSKHTSSEKKSRSHKSDEKSKSRHSDEKRSHSSKSDKKDKKRKHDGKEGESSKSKKPSVEFLSFDDSNKVKKPVDKDYEQLKAKFRIKKKGEPSQKLLAPSKDFPVVKRKNAEQESPVASKTANLDDSEMPYALPAPQTHYRPWRFSNLEDQKNVTEEPFDDSAAWKKNYSRTQVYSGKKQQTVPEVYRLYDICLQNLMNNIDNLDFVGGVPFDILKPVLEKCNPVQLYRLEDCNPVFLEDSDYLWQRHCEREFKRSKPEELESWRELYWRKHDERQEKLHSLKNSISASMAQKLPVKTTKLAYIDSAAKPPREVRRQQMKHGTAGPSSGERSRKFNHLLEPVPVFKPTSVKRAAPMMQKTLTMIKKMRK